MKNKFKVFTTIKTVFDVVIIAVIAVYISAILIQRVSGNKSVLGYRMFNVASESMIPVYKINDIIVVKDCNPTALQIGDDIAYIGKDNSLNGKIITHRIIDIDNSKGELTTKGVNNDLVDPSITTKQVIGKVVGVVPFISFINKLVMTQAGFYFLIFVPVVLIACMEIAETIIEGKIEKKELVEIKD
ncbi:MAG: signal peptidase I [Bacilli bacterium]|nr:signal peptidase I [Bacilli bacterium]